MALTRAVPFPHGRDRGLRTVGRRLGRAVLGLLYVGRHENTEAISRQDWHRRRAPLGEPQHSGGRERQTALVPVASEMAAGTARILEPLRAAATKASDLVLLHIEANSNSLC